MTERYVALIRHGEYHQKPDTPSAQQPYPLTETGMAQARRCGQEIVALLAEKSWALDPQIHSSRQLRAWQTAQSALQELATAGHRGWIVQSDALSERSVGSAANLTLTEIEAVLRADPRYHSPPAGWKSNSDYCLPLPGAESLMMSGQRVAEHLRRVVQAPADGPVLTLVFGHGAAFRHASHCLGVLERGEIAALSMYHAQPLLLCYNGADKWVHCGGAWKRRGKTEIALD